MQSLTLQAEQLLQMCSEHSFSASGDSRSWKPAAQICDTSIGVAVEQHNSLTASAELLEGTSRIGVCSL